MLEGFDQDWNYVGNQNRATYTNLSAGTYTFRVKATNNDGLWSDYEAGLRVIVEPPFWWSWYAKLFYLVLIAAAISFYIHFRLKRAERLHQRQLQQLSEKKEEEVRETRQNFFTMIALEPVTETAQNSADNEFLTKINQIIQDNFANPDLNVDFLAEKLNISRSGLFAKIKTLADITPNEMIQIVRLKRAAQLLRNGEYLVSEVAYMVGFSNPSYFSKCFYKQFGIRPTEIKTAT
jgi:AraC-like DNA-binding protein